MDADSQLRNLRDFLLVYNRMTEICFQRCTANFNYRNLTMDEERCVDHCASKLIRSNHRLMGTYVKLMPAMVQRRMEEMESKAAEAAKMEEVAGAPAPLAGASATPGSASAMLSAEHVMTAETPATSVSFPPLAAEPMLSDLSSVPAPATGGTAALEVLQARESTIPSLGLQTANVSLVPSLNTEPTTQGSAAGTSSSINSSIVSGIQIDKLALKQVTVDSSSINSAVPGLEATVGTKHEKTS